MADFKLLIGDDVTAELSDGSLWSNMDSDTAAELIKGQREVRASLTDDSALPLVERMARDAGMKVLRVPNGVLLRQHFQPADTRPRGGMIVLAPEEVFTSCERALSYVHDMQSHGRTPPGRYHTDLTQTFLQGTPAGQVQSLWKDLRAYGLDAVRTKVQAFLEYAATGPEPYPSYIRRLDEGVLPHHVEAHVGRMKIDQTFAKFWLLRELAGRG
jgi:hypothetical protein